MAHFFRIKTSAYFNVRMNAEQPANILLVSNERSRDLHIAQMTNQGCSDFTVTELTAAEYRAEALAKLNC